MTRLVFISTLAYNYFFPENARQAGGHTRVANLAKAFAKTPGYEVFCITGDLGQPRWIKKDGVTLIKAPIDRPLSVINVIKTIKGLNPDLLVDVCASPRLFLYSVLKKITGLRYIFLTSSDIDVNGNYAKIENPLYDYFYMKGLKHADSIIAQIPYHKSQLKDNWGLKSHLVLSPYFEIEKPEKGPSDSVLWVGRAAFYKRPELFLSLARKFADHKFIMICNKSSYDKGFSKLLTREKRQLTNLKFYDYVPYPQMKNFYKQAKFLVNTSDAEGFANTFIEAAIHQTPILSLNSDPNDMLSFHGGGFACNGDFNRMKETCDLLLKNDELVTSAGKKAFEYAYKHHRIEKAVVRLDKIFKSILFPAFH